MLQQKHAKVKLNLRCCRKLVAYWSQTVLVTPAIGNAIPVVGGPDVMAEDVIDRRVNVTDVWTETTAIMVAGIAATATATQVTEGCSFI